MLPFNQELGVHEQSAGFTSHQVWDFAGTPADRYPLLLHFPYFDLYRKQVIKQADLVLAMHLRGHAFTSEEKTRNFAYYEPLTVRDSSLSVGSQAVMAAEVGQLRLAYDYLGEAAMMDLANLERNTRDGLHIASLAGTWTRARSGLWRDETPRGRPLLRPATARADQPAGFRCAVPPALRARGHLPPTGHIHLAGGRGA